MSHQGLHFFVVDDEADARERFVGMLDTSFVTPVNGPTEAESLLAGSPSFDVALVDMFYPVEPVREDEGEMLAVPIIQRIAARVPAALIIAYSGDSDKVDEFAAELTEAGADLVCKRFELLRRKDAIFDMVARARENRREKLERTRSLSPASEPISALDRALVAEVGHDVLLEAVVAAKVSSREDKYTTLAGGRSGDWVVHMASSEIGRPRSEWVLKLSRSPERLADELGGAPLLGEGGGLYAARNDVGVLRLSDGWVAITSDFAPEAVPLRSYIKSASASDTIEAIGQLEDIVRQRFSRAARADSLSSNVERTLSWRFVAEVEAAGADLLPWLRDFDTSTTWKDMIGWLHSGAAGEWKLIEASTKVCVSHGDFHGGNVLVGNRSRALDLIDFALARIAPRLEDFASMLMDLTVHDELGGDWGSLTAGEVQDIAARLGSLNVATGAASAVWNQLGSEHRVAAAAWYKVGLTLFAACPTDESLRSLVLQALRFARFEDLPHAVRAVLMLWAGSVFLNLQRA